VKTIHLYGLYIAQEFPNCGASAGERCCSLGLARVACIRDIYFERNMDAIFSFFPVPVCAITASGVSGSTFVSMNRFSILCG
jgi:hypothetical protein